MATAIPRCAASTAKARPIPEPAPVISTHFGSRGMAQLRTSAKVVENRAVQSVEDYCVVDDDALGLAVIETVDQLPEERDVFAVQRSVSSKIAKSAIALQTERRLHGIGDLISRQYGHPLEDVRASEKCIGADMFDSVVRVTDHDPAGRSSLAIANRSRVPAE